MTDDRDYTRSIARRPAVWAVVIGAILLIAAAIVYAFVRATWYFWLILILGIIFLVLGFIWLLIREVRPSHEDHEDMMYGEDEGICDPRDETCLKTVHVQPSETLEMLAPTY